MAGLPALEAAVRNCATISMQPIFGCYPLARRLFEEACEPGWRRKNQEDERGAYLRGAYLPGAYIMAGGFFWRTAVA
jgi:hypothetical protein